MYDVRSSLLRLCDLWTGLARSYRENSAPDAGGFNSLLSQNRASVFVRNYNACRMLLYFDNCDNNLSQLWSMMQHCVPKHVCEGTVLLASPHGTLADLGLFSTRVHYRFPSALTACATQVWQNLPER